MANINDVFGEYDESKPMVSFNLPSKEELISELLGLIPGGRALKNFHDNPEGPASETLSLAAEDVVPFYGAAKNDANIEDILKEAAILGVPMPYIKHPKTGKPIPNNLKEGLGYKGWHTAKSLWSPNTSRNPRKLYTAETVPNRYITSEKYGKGEGLATTHRVNRNQIAVPAEQVFGPNKRTDTGANIQNTGKQAVNTNTIRVVGRKGYLKGDRGWQGDMYPPNRSLRKDDFVGPQQWEDKYSRKLDAAIDENEYKWEYLINQTRPVKSGPRPLPKEEIIDIALKQGRPDIAQRVINDNKPRVSNRDDQKFASYQSTKSFSKLTNEQWKDIGNRQIEKELRETFASLPNDPDIRYRFAEHYGVPDLYQSWINDPLPWEKLKVDTKFNRSNREQTNRTRDRQYQRNIQR